MFHLLCDFQVRNTISYGGNLNNMEMDGKTLLDLVLAFEDQSSSLWSPLDRRGEI